MYLKIQSAVVALMVFIFPLVGQAGSQADLADQKNCQTRPLSDFLNAQGELVQFFPPVNDYVGWFDAPFVNFGLVDYAGLANDYITDQTGQSLGTTSSGRILECELPDGRAKVSVVLNTKKALGFAQSIAEIIDCVDFADFDPSFLCADTIFGATAQDVVAGAEPAVGPASLRTSFVISAPGEPLPDFVDVVNDPATYKPVTLSFRSTTVGKRPDGTRARLIVQQVAATDADGNLVFSREIVDLNK